MIHCINLNFVLLLMVYFASKKSWYVLTQARRLNYDAMKLNARLALRRKMGNKKICPNSEQIFKIQCDVISVINPPSFLSTSLCSTSGHCPAIDFHITIPVKHPCKNAWEQHVH